MRWHATAWCAVVLHCAQHQFDSKINLYSFLIKQLSINVAARGESDQLDENEQERTEHNNGIYRSCFERTQKPRCA